MTESPQISAAVEKTSRVQAALAEIARDGFAPARGLPEGNEVRRGAVVLIRLRAGGETVSRWVLVGRELESSGEVIGLFRFARAPQGAGEIGEIAASLAGAAGVRARGETSVHGHDAVWVESSEWCLVEYTKRNEFGVAEDPLFKELHKPIGR